MPRPTVLATLFAPVLSLVLATSLAAAPLLAKIGATSINLVLPSGLCAIDKSQWADAQYLKLLGEAARSDGGNGILAGFADCRQLADWRAGKKAVLDDHGQYQTMLRLANSELSKLTVGQICQGLRKRGDRSYADIPVDEIQRLERVADGLQVNEVRFLGVVGEDENACYSALVEDAQSTNGVAKVQAGVYATSLIRGKLLYFYLFTPYRGADTIGRLVEVVKATMGDLQLANRQ